MVSFVFNFQAYLGEIPILTNIFQMGWNHQLVDDIPQTFQASYWIGSLKKNWRGRQRAFISGIDFAHVVGKSCHEYSGLVETFALFVLSKEIGLLMCFTPKIGEGDHGFEKYYIIYVLQLGCKQQARKTFVYGCFQNSGTQPPKSSICS